LSDSDKTTVQDGVRPTWRRFLDDLVPFRPDLHRYCRRLTGNVWDAVDLVQDTLLRVFGLMGKSDATLKDPRAYVIRTATNLWIDQMRRQDVHKAALAVEAERETIRMARPSLDGERSLEVRDAAEQLIGRLAPRERAALLLKDVFDLSLEDTALALRTSIGAIKSALHRGRGHLKEIDPEIVPNPRVSAELLERFMAALTARDVEALFAVVGETATAELVGGVVMEGRENYKVFFAHMLAAVPLFGPEHVYPRHQLVTYEGEPVVLGFRHWNGQWRLNEVSRLEEDEGKISRIRCYCWSPDTLRFIGQQLGLPVLTDAEGLIEAVQKLTGSSRPPTTGGYRSP
jgi:RNA polymerase sigma-70 factor (ECF subfamily)